MSSRISSFVSAAVLLAVTPSAQSLEEVREVVPRLRIPESTEEAKALLVEWGDAALPALRTLLDEDALESAFPVLAAIAEIRTEAAGGVLVDYLAESEDEDRLYVLSLLASNAGTAEVPELSSRMPAHPGFKPAIRGIAEKGTWLMQGMAARVAASQGWEDFEPLIARMVEDGNPSLREIAAGAYFELTGRVVTPERPEAVFTGTNLIPGLVSEPVEIELDSVPRIAEGFLRTAEGVPTTFFVGDGRSFRSFPPSAEARQQTFPAPVIDLLCVEPFEGPYQFVGLVSKQGFGGAGADYAASFDLTGQELWRYSPPQRGLDTAAVLYGDEGAFGVVFGPGGEEGIVAVGCDGERLWDISGVHVMYEVVTHPALPGKLLVVNGQATIADYGPAEVDAEAVRGAFMRNLRSGSGPLFAITGVLYPGDGGRPECVVATTGVGSADGLVCLQDGDQRRWTIPLPGRVTQLAMLEPAGRERLFVVSTITGHLYLLDETGTMRWQGRLPGGALPGQHHVFEMVAGSHGPRGLMFALRTRHGYWYYSVNAAAIPATPR